MRTHVVVQDGKGQVQSIFMDHQLYRSVPDGAQLVPVCKKGTACSPDLQPR